jgi:isoleucyl-tRNA synthetase
LLSNPATPFLSEALYQTIYKTLDDSLPETVNLESWPTPDKDLEDAALEEEFEILLQVLPILYSARQNAQLKRRWPLAKAIVVAPKNVQEAIQKLETLFLELGNIRAVEYADDLTGVDSERWAMASEGETQVLLNKIRDDALEGEGLMRDLARRVQVLRKELGFSPTDIVDSVHVADLQQKDVELLNPFLVEMQELVRAKKVHVHMERIDVNADWHENKLDKKKVYVAVL